MSSTKKRTHDDIIVALDDIANKLDYCEPPSLTEVERNLEAIYNKLDALVDATERIANALETSNRKKYKC